MSTKLNSLERIREALGEASVLFMSKECKGTEIIMPTEELERIAQECVRGLTPTPSKQCKNPECTNDRCVGCIGFVPAASAESSEEVEEIYTMYDLRGDWAHPEHKEIILEQLNKKLADILTKMKADCDAKVEAAVEETEKRVSNDYQIALAETLTEQDHLKVNDMLEILALKDTNHKT